MQFFRQLRQITRLVAFNRISNFQTAYYFSMKQGTNAEQFDETIEEVKVVQGLTVKEIKKIVRPTFEKNPELFYPTKVFEGFGFHRNQCPKCQHFYWRKSVKQDTCGDSGCVGKYSFIGRGTGIGRKGQKITYAQAWEGFKKSLTNAKVPCTAIERYPVVARWRNDVEYVAAGIYCFQPYCVTGELAPPANPLICNQFCVRFNDLDNIGLTGRHYSGFVMLGIQVFNYPDKYVFFKDECVEFNYRWLTEELEIDPEEITFVEDIWAGGGNMGPSVEYFVNGLELGNMVFMQYKYFPDATYEELPIKIIDTGIGLERIPWLINGSATSYIDVFQDALKYLQNAVGQEINQEIWDKLGPYSCTLNIDEVENIEQTWQQISDQIGVDVQSIKDAIQPVKDLYIVLDHTRTVLVIIYDGSLPSNVGGGSNVRNILRRVFAILKKNGWWDKIKMEGFLELFRYHIKDLERMYGPFPTYISFNDIIKLEYERWLKNDDSQKAKVEKMLKKNKQLTLDDWIMAITSHGISADAVAAFSGQPIPGNLYYELSQRAERITKAAEVILYNTVHLPETKNLYYADNKLTHFHAKIVEVFENIKDDNKRNIVILDQSTFYPTSGGQLHDTGLLKFDGEEYRILNAEKVGKCVLHFLDRPLVKETAEYIGKPVDGYIDGDRRSILRNHHTATHIIFAACREVLGPHVWQAGAKKTLENAHLDITHFQTLTKEQEQQIESRANRIILAGHQVTKTFMDKAEAEKQYGFRLYQGGIVPGNDLRVVKIEDTDVEACCGTHCDNTNEVGWVRILKSQKIQDGIVRLYYVAGVRTIDVLKNESEMITSLQKLWGIPKNQIVTEAEKIFTEKKHFESEYLTIKAELIKSQMQYVVDLPNQLSVIVSGEPNATAYFSEVNKYAKALKEQGKGVIYVAETFIFGFLANPALLNFEEFEQAISTEGDKLKVNKQNKVQVPSQGKKNVPLDGVVQFNIMGKFNQKKAVEFLQSKQFKRILS